MKPKFLWQYTATELAAELAEGRVSSSEIVSALHERADAVEPSINGYAVQLREQARRDAEEADRERAGGRVRSPLHGVPLTIKENIDVCGTPATLGLQRRLGHVALADAVIVRLARAAGMVVLGKSNLPQALVSGMECDNPIYGVTRNPFSLRHGPGGSSGGEGTLIASGASPLGLGTDLGGSIRFPAAFCGIAGLKPTTHRWSNLGIHSLLTGQEVIRAQVGPMARCVADLRLLMRVLPGVLQARYDADVAPFPADEETAVDVRGLRLGWYDDDGFLSPAASVQRAVRETALALQELGAELVPLPPIDQRAALQLYVAAVSSDGLRTAKRQLTGDAIADTMRELWWAAHVPQVLRRAAANVLPILGEARLAALLGASGRRNVEEYWQLAERRRQLKVAELAQWNDYAIDAILCPVAATPPVPIGKSRGLAAAFSYTARYNLLGFPAGVVPVTRVRADETARPLQHDRLDRLAAAVEAESVGLPIAVQVVGRPYREDQVLRVLGAIEAWAQQRADFPHTPVDPSPGATLAVGT